MLRKIWQQKAVKSPTSGSRGTCVQGIDVFHWSDPEKRAIYSIFVFYVSSTRTLVATFWSAAPTLSTSLNDLEVIKATVDLSRSENAISLLNTEDDPEEAFHRAEICIDTAAIDDSLTDCQRYVEKQGRKFQSFVSLQGSERSPQAGIGAIETLRNFRPWDEAFDAAFSAMKTPQHCSAKAFNPPIIKTTNKSIRWSNR